MIKRIQFENYRCFKNSSISFKDITTIVGKNNAGKSTVIEALRMISSASNRAGSATYIKPPESLEMPIAYKGFKINTEKLRIDLRTVVYFYLDTTATITATFKDKSKIVIYVNSEVAFACIFDKEGEIVSTRSKVSLCDLSLINILPQIGLIKENERYIAKDTIVADRDTYLSSRHFRNELLLYKDDFYDEFCSLAESTWPGLRIRTLEYQPGQNEYIYFAIEDSEFTSEIGLMGSGIQMWLQIIWFICKSKNCKTIILDEPDVYMHPDLQRKLLRIIKRRFEQVIIATHSVEIISDVEPRFIVDINKFNRSMAYASSKKGVQNIIDGLGSIHNIALVRIANTKKCLFVEGKDIKILSRFYEKLHPESDYSLETLPTVSLGGWSRLDEAFGTSNLFYGETNDQIKCYCILDRDYYTNETIQTQMKRAIDCNLILHIWKKKEIENYVIVPSAIFRITKLPANEFDNFYKKIGEIVDEFKTYVTDQISDQIQKLDRGKSLPTCNSEARIIVESRWTTLENKISIVSGKELLSRINLWIKEEFGETCSLTRILRSIKEEEIDPEIKQVIESLIS